MKWSYLALTPVVAALILALLLAGAATAHKDARCSEFSSQEEAQAYFAEHGGTAQDNNTPYLDKDGDGQACEEHEYAAGGEQDTAAQPDAPTPTPAPQPTEAPAPAAGTATAPTGHAEATQQVGPEEAQPTAPAGNGGGSEVTGLPSTGGGGMPGAGLPVGQVAAACAALASAGYVLSRRR